MQFVQALPQSAQVIGDLIAKNMDWPGADLIAERLKKMLPPGMAEEDKDLTEEEIAEQQQMMQKAQAEEEEGKQMMKQGMALDVQLKGKQVEKETASIEEIKARTVKINEEAEAQGIENDATESGISEVIEGLAAMPQEATAKADV